MTAMLQLPENNLADHWKTCSKGMELKTGFKYIWNPAQESGDPEWRRHNLTHCTHGQLKIRVRKKKKRKSELEDKVWLLAHCSFSHQSHPSSWDLLLSFQEEFESLRGKMLAGWLCLLRSSVQFSRSVVSDSLQPYEPQHTRPPCPSPTPGVYPNSCPLSRWCHPTISSSVVPFSSCPQSFPAPGSFPVSPLFASSSAPYKVQCPHLIYQIGWRCQCLASTCPAPAVTDSAPSQRSFPNSALKSKLPACPEAISSVSSTGFSGIP